MSGRFTSSTVRRRRPATAAITMAFSLLCAACGGGGGGSDPTSPISPPPPPPPPPPVTWNFVVIYTDDQRRDSLSSMPLLEERIFSKGVRFRNAYVPTPSCTTSRASTFSGGFLGQNTGVKENGGPNGHFRLFADSKSLATSMQSAGYQTMFAGKYLNDYPKNAPYVPPGWTRFMGRASHATSRNWNDFNYIVGSTEADAPGTGTEVNAKGKYTSEFERDGILEFLDTADPGQPFMILLSTTPPHSPATPVPGEEGLFWDYELDPARVETDLSDKPEWVRNYSALVNDVEFARDQLTTLQAVDRSAAAIFDKVAEMGKSDSTVFLFLSDNGYSWGEHSAWGKGNPYEESIGVPFVVSMPGVSPRDDDSLVYATLDGVATIYDLAGIDAPSDGESLLPLLENPANNVREQIFFESYGGWIGGYGAWTAIRGSQWKYIEHGNGEHELYDLVSDPLERDSQHDNPDYDSIERQLAEEIADFQGIMIKPMHYVSVGYAARPFRQELEVLGGVGPYQWSVYSGELPDGLTLDPDTGVIAGVPAGVGDYILRYKVVGAKIARHQGDPQRHVSRQQKISIRP